ncbi:carbohydrate ABC transporter substrate-binding protein, CUT1 family [Pseudooceanicola antarcticus]|uniref:sn-glycerol-3-phosphate-binding periplasmic protein UgpB n=1 Tax=Pseudooceanicola antarcticus TaxID=1247613 RepID=A0A285IJU6_9RHOB|nr:sn-glycerol-3-phosphate ABC transporter substrate-binding protein UgpB [Pseudooceanicola antarcticus]PJE28783.1 sn-glycerol-3-phosphate ABC transporter substrate-binding protein UgpB [Pseudooceanicola antarcticus]SNY48255.1 carbohydrate ABC transporter substrate-binding protein, CUT1 family [Pseudooceanicola antarcticus]
MQRSLMAGLVLTSALVAPLAASAQTEITWWHAMGGRLGEKVDEIVAAYNDSQDQFHLTATYKGGYAETMTSAIAAFRAGEQPDLVQVYEVGTGTMMAAEGAVYPIYQLMEDHGQDFDPSAYLSAVAGYYTNTDGQMLSMPFNSSTPILYYNKDIFAAAGLDPDVAPVTWADVEAASRAIVESGAATCGFTSGWISWVQLENFSAWHNQQIGTNENGFGSMDSKLTVNGPVQARHWENLAKWQAEGLFKYGGPAGGADAPPAFYSGECAIYMNSSASRAGVLTNIDFDLGLGMLPYYADVEGAPQNSIIGGATLWALAGASDDEYEGLADFLTFLSSAEVQADFHQFSGYLPITNAAYELSIEQGYYDENPGADLAIKQITLNEPTANSKGLRFGNYVQIRGVIDEEFEALLAGDKTAQEALDDLVERGNSLIADFVEANG